jgi:hypothetical protein
LKSSTIKPLRIPPNRTYTAIHPGHDTTSFQEQGNINAIRALMITNRPKNEPMKIQIDFKNVMVSSFNCLTYKLPNKYLLQALQQFRKF